MDDTLLIVMGGPNGSGKSTITHELEKTADHIGASKTEFETALLNYEKSKSKWIQSYMYLYINL